MIAIDLSKQQALNADSKEIQQINFSWNIDWDNGVVKNTVINKWN